MTTTISHSTCDGFVVLTMPSITRRSGQLTEDQIKKIARALARSDGVPDDAPVGDYYRNAKDVAAELAAYNPNENLLFRQLRDLAVSLHRRHYPKVTQWKLLDDAPGVLSQIDNMTTGLSRNPNDKLREALEASRRALQRMMDTWLDYHDAHSLTEPVTGASANAFDDALAARDMIDAALSHKD